MDTSEIYNILNAAAKKTFGEKAIKVKDKQSLILLGDVVLSSEQITEKFYKNLCDICKTYSLLRRDDTEWNKMVQKIFFKNLIDERPEIYLYTTEEEKANKIYDLYRRDFKYKDYFNYKGGYKNEKIH